MVSLKRYDLSTGNYCHFANSSGQGPMSLCLTYIRLFVVVSYEGSMSVPADPPCTPGTTLDPNSTEFKAQEKAFCDQVNEMRFSNSKKTVDVQISTRKTLKFYRVESQFCAMASYRNKGRNYKDNTKRYDRHILHFNVTFCNLL